MLKSSTKAEAANLWTLEVSISAEDFEAAQKKAWNKLKNKVSYPGFRKGKVPRNMAEKVYGEGFLYEDALDICYPEAAQAAIEEAGIDFVGTGKVDVTEIGKAGVEVTIEVYSKPEANIENYKGLEAEVAPFEVTDAEVEAKLNELVERNSRVISVEDRAAEMGDIANINFEGFIDDVAFDGGKGENYDLTLGSGQFIPGFEDQIVGKNIGDAFDVNVTFPEEYGSDELAGKAAVFKCTLNGLQVKELPEVNDEFAQDAADFDTLDELKASLKDELVESKKNSQKDQVRAAVLEKVANIVEVEIPDCMIDTEVDNQARDIDYRLQSQGMSLELYLQYMGQTMDEYKESIRESAEKNVKVRLALEKIAALENIEVTDEDLEAEYAKFAEGYSMSVEDVKKYVAASDLTGDLKVNRAVDLLIDNAVVTEVEPTAEADINVDDIVEAVEAIESEEE